MARLAGVPLLVGGRPLALWGIAATVVIVAVIIIIIKLLQVVSGESPTGEGSVTPAATSARSRVR